MKANEMTIEQFMKACLLANDSGMKAGEQIERNRIIKLLEETDKHLIIWDKSYKKSGRLVHGPKCGICASIALIKGSN